jgi:hypothetical protein
MAATLAKKQGVHTRPTSWLPPHLEQRLAAFRRRYRSLVRVVFSRAHSAQRVPSRSRSRPQWMHRPVAALFAYAARSRATHLSHRFPCVARDPHAHSPTAALARRRSRLMSAIFRPHAAHVVKLERAGSRPQAVQSPAALRPAYSVLSGMATLDRVDAVTVVASAVFQTVLREASTPMARNFLGAGEPPLPRN